MAVKTKAQENLFVGAAAVQGRPAGPSVSAPTMLDLFSGLGGASAAMRDRGWDVVTVDVVARFRPTFRRDVDLERPVLVEEILTWLASAVTKGRGDPAELLEDARRLSRPDLRRRRTRRRSGRRTRRSSRVS